MALSSIVKNIYTFANILSQAGTDAVEKWNEKSLQNALNWATYCQKIAEQTTGSSFRSDLDIQIQSFTVLLKPPSLLYLTLDYLGDAKVILCKRLLHNPYSPVDIIEKIAGSQGVNLSDVLGRRKEVRCTFVDEPRLYQLLGEDFEFSGGSLTAISAYILDRLLHLSTLCVVSEHRFNNFLELIVTKIADCSKGLEVLAYLLLSDVKCISQHTDIVNLKDRILKIVLQIGNSNRCIWSSDVQLLCELSSRDDQFLDHHIQHILTWVNRMEPVYGTTDQGELYTWRCSDSTTERTSYRALVKHVTNFIHHNKRLRANLIAHLDNLANQSYFNICRDLLKCVL